MIRNVLKLGRNTLVVSLPSEWAKKNKIEKGQEMEVVEKDSEITFSLQKAKGPGQITIDVSGKSKSACWKLLFAAYVKGYDEIIIKYSKEEKKRIINEIKPVLIGMELTKETENIVVLTQLSETREEEFFRIYSKIYLVEKSIIKEGISAIMQGDFEALKKLKSRDMYLNRFVMFCLRTINRMTAMSSDKKTFYYNTITNLEQMGDVFADFFERLGEEKTKFGSVEKGIIKEFGECVDELSVIIYKPDYTKIINIYERTKTIKNRCFDLDNQVAKINILWIASSIGNLIESILSACIE